MTALKRTFKMVESLVKEGANTCLLATAVLSPLLFGVYRGLLTPSAAAVHFVAGWAGVEAAAAAGRASAAGW